MELSPVPSPTKLAMYGVGLEEALNVVGYGRFQIWISFVGGLCFLSAGFQNSLSAYILPSIKCDMGITSSEMGLLNAVFLAGGLGSGIFWGSLVDTVGRWPVLFFGMFLDGFFTCVSTLSPNFYIFLGFRFLNGFVVGGPSSIVLAYIGEFHPLKYRSQIICYIGLFWALSWVILPFVAWVVIPLDIAWTAFSIQFNSWRLLVVLSSLPSLLSAALLLTLPESPKFLLNQHRPAEAIAVLDKAFSTNSGQPNSFPVKSFERIELPSPVNCSNKSVWRPVISFMKQCKSLFVGPTLLTTALTSYLFFSNMFGYYGLGLWLPELDNRFEAHESVSQNSSVSVCELSDVTQETRDCSKTVPSSVFIHSVIIGAATLVGNLASGFLSPLLPRKAMPVFLMLSAAGCVLALYLIRTSLQLLIVCALFQLFIGTANTVYNALVVDLFPTEISGMAVCVSIMMGRFGAMVSNLVFGHLLDISCSIPILLCAAFITSGGLLSGFIPGPYSLPKVKSVIPA